MGLKFAVKNCLITAIVTYSMTAFAIDANHHNTTNCKQIDPSVVKSSQAIETWVIHPPYDGYGFGQWYDDHRIQKIIVHVNNTLSNTNEIAGTVKLTCNGTTFTIDA